MNPLATRPVRTIVRDLSLEGVSMTTIQCEPYGELADGTGVERYTLHDGSFSVAVITYGARIESIHTPDRRGRVADVVLGFDSLQGYVGGHQYTGALVGRFANRIARGRFHLGDQEYHLAVNSPPNALHGGIRGFAARVWRAQVDGGSLMLTYRSGAGEEGYPGQMDVNVRYGVGQGRLRIDYAASTDRATAVNLTNHSYFNLTGNPASPILGHVVTLPAEHYTPVDTAHIPTGEIRSVENSPFDFTTPTPVGARIDDPDEQLEIAGGYDHNWVLPTGVGTFARAATAYEPASGRLLEVFTTEPGLQFYSGNSLTGERGPRRRGSRASLRTVLRNPALSRFAQSCRFPVHHAAPRR